MNIKVVYCSETGNTKKIANAIADAIGVGAEEISENMQIEDIDLLFVGGFLKAFTLVKATKLLLKSLNNPAQTKKVAVFSTSASGNGIRKYADKYLKNSGIQIVGDFAALGSYMKSNPGRPNEEDCADAAKFAQTVAESVKNI